MNTIASLPPRGVQANNPLCIRHGVPWNGLSKVQSDPAFDTFINAPYGFRAAFMNYEAYKRKYGIDTVRKLITKWAPPEDDNDTEAYIATVCKLSGFGPDETVDLASWEDASKLIYAQTAVECTSFTKYFQMWQLEEGARMAGVVGIPPKPLAKTLSGIGTAVTAVTSAAIVAGPEIVSTAQQYMPSASAIPALSSALKVVLMIGIALTILGLIRKNKRHGV